MEKVNTLKYNDGFLLHVSCPNGTNNMVGSFGCEKCINFVKNDYEKCEVLCKGTPIEIAEAEKAYPWDEGEGGDEEYLNEERKNVERLRASFIKGWNAHKKYESKNRKKK